MGFGIKGITYREGIRRIMATKKELRERIVSLEGGMVTLSQELEAAKSKLFAKEREEAVMSGQLTANLLMNNEAARMKITHFCEPVLHPKLHVSFDLVYMAGKEPRWLVTEKNVSYSD
jgi:hypothetical protein